MSNIGVFIALLALGVPVVWFASEFQERRWLRLLLGSISIILSIFVAVVVGSAERFNSNAWFSTASKSLMNATVEELEAGNNDRVIRALKRLQEKYHPTYENRARYDVLVEETIVEMGRPPTPAP
ncbi:MAG: hypothetical protein P4L85_08400 [Paludisphaera borealis]|uniref:hypothetical protein n=1 Tax=Paludisphaera borealis TaxID=1387353 RepID=UPI00284DBFC6|nr:hypothetical protein [Paludisphaera borealis]MDR3619357.1 hypothetical protein [Paludisphaera borealis]